MARVECDDAGDCPGEACCFTNLMESNWVTTICNDDCDTWDGAEVGLAGGGPELDVQLPPRQTSVELPQTGFFSGSWKSQYGIRGLSHPTTG